MLLGVDPWHWRTIPTLRLKYESVAAAAVALRLMDREGRSWTDSLLRTCVHLGLNYETVRKRLGGWHSSSRCLPAGWEEPIDAVLE